MTAQLTPSNPVLELWNILSSPLIGDVEQIFKDYAAYAAGQEVTTPVETFDLPGGAKFGARATIVRRTTGIPIDLQPGYLYGLIAQQGPLFLEGKVVVLPSFTIPFLGEYADVTLKIQLIQAPQGEPAPSAKPAIAAPAETGVAAELDKEFPPA